jgi:hypothetical protein
MSPKKNDAIIETPPADSQADAMPPQATPARTRKRGRPEDRSIVSDAWGATGPDGEPPNIRLRHTPEDSYDRQMLGEWYPARTDVKQGVRYLLPTNADGTPDEALQRAGFYHPDAHRIVRFADYALIKR